MTTEAPLACNLCKNNDPTTFKYYCESPMRPYYECQSCQLISVPKSHHVEPNYEKSRYLQHNNDIEDEGYVKFLMQVVDVCKEHCVDVHRALDFGCGYNPVLKTLLEEHCGYDVFCYDAFFYPEMPPGKFDCVVSTEVFEHFCDVDKEMKVIKDLVEPGKYLVVMTQLYRDNIAFEKWWYQRDDTHVSYFREETFNFVADKYDFDVKYSNGKSIVILQKK